MVFIGPDARFPSMTCGFTKSHQEAKPKFDQKVVSSTSRFSCGHFSPSTGTFSGIHFGTGKIKDSDITSSVENVDLDFLNALAVSVSRNSNFARPPGAQGQTFACLCGTNIQTNRQTPAGRPSPDQPHPSGSPGYITFYGLRCIIKLSSFRKFGLT